MRNKKNMNFKKSAVVSLLSGASILFLQSHESKAMFGKKSLTSIFGSSSKTSGKSGRLNNITSVKWDSPKELGKRNSLLSSLEKQVSISDRKIPMQPVIDLLKYEPDKYKRDTQTGEKIYTHRSEGNNFKVKVNMDGNTGEIDKVQVKISGRKIDFNKTRGDYIFSDGKQTLPKTSTIKPGAPESSAGGDPAVRKKVPLKQSYKVQEDSQALIDSVYRTKGLDEKLLFQALDNYNGDIQGDGLEKNYVFNGEKGNTLTVYLSNDDALKTIILFNNGSKLEKNYIGVQYKKGNAGEEIKKFKSQTNSQELIDRVLETKGSSKGVLYDAVKNYSGDVEITELEDIYVFNGEGKNNLSIFMNKQGEITNIKLMNNGEKIERSYEGNIIYTFYKTGYFEADGIKEVIEKPVYKYISDTGEEKFAVLEKDGEYRNVLEKGGNMFAYILSKEQASIYRKIKSENIVEAKNKWGETKRVILEEIEINGKVQTVAYQLDDGIWRGVTKSKAGVLWLGDVIKYENLVSEVASKLRKAAKLYSRYAVPVVSGVSSMSKTLSGLSK